MSQLILISTHHCSKLFKTKVPAIREILRKGLIEFVRDDSDVYKISLKSALNYAYAHQVDIDKDYLRQIDTKVAPWREDSRGLYGKNTIALDIEEEIRNFEE